MTESKVIEMVKELAEMGIIAQWHQDSFDYAIIVEEWDITNGREFEKASAFAHKMKEAAKAIDCFDGMLELTIPDKEHDFPIDLIISCVWL